MPVLQEFLRIPVESEVLMPMYVLWAAMNAALMWAIYQGVIKRIKPMVIWLSKEPGEGRTLYWGDRDAIAHQFWAGGLWAVFHLALTNGLWWSGERTGAMVVWAFMAFITLSWAVNLDIGFPFYALPLYEPPYPGTAGGYKPLMWACRRMRQRAMDREPATCP